MLLACCNLAAGKMHVVLCLCLLQFVNKCQENEDLVVKMFSRPRMYFFFPKENRGRQADNLMVHDALIKMSVWLPLIL